MLHSYFTETEGFPSSQHFPPPNPPRLPNTGRAAGKTPKKSPGSPSKPPQRIGHNQVTPHGCFPTQQPPRSLWIIYLTPWFAIPVPNSSPDSALGGHFSRVLVATNSWWEGERNKAGALSRAPLLSHCCPVALGQARAGCPHVTTSHTKPRPGPSCPALPSCSGRAPWGQELPHQPWALRPPPTAVLCATAAPGVPPLELAAAGSPRGKARTPGTARIPAP